MIIADQVPTKPPSRWPLILATLFCAYSLGLLYNAFSTESQLKKAAEARLVVDGKRRAAAVAAFAAEQFRVARVLAKSHEIQIYAKKAGQAGPVRPRNSALDAVELHLRYELESEHYGEHKMFDRIAFVNAQGEVLAAAQRGAPGPAPRWNPKDGALRLDPERARLVAVAPVEAEGVRVGDVFVETELSQIYNLLDSGSGVAYREALLGLGEREIIPAGRAALFPGDLAATVERMPLDVATALPRRAAGGASGGLPDDEYMVGVKTPVAGLPLSLVTALHASDLYAGLHDWLPLLALGVLPVLVFLVTLRMDQLQARAQRLAMSVARSDYQGQFLQGQNEILSREIHRRERIEQDLEHHREHLEEQVQRRTAELNSLFLALPDTYFRLDRDGAILDSRGGEERGAQASAEGLTGRKLQEVLPPEGSAGAVKALAQIADGSPQCVFEYGARVEGGERFYEARMLPLGQDERVVVVRDVSVRHTLEQSREANRREAERLARSKSEFLANMSHEIRTPLNGILGMAQIGLRDSWGRSNNQKVFSHIMASGRLLMGVIDDILDFSKMEAGKLALEQLPVDLHRVLQHACEVVDERARAKGISLSLRPAPNLPASCLGDPLRLEQILLNLLTNAVKFTEQGGVVLVASAEAGSLVFAVSDTGIGMDAAQRARLFTPFEQADGSITRRFGGTGLGLTIVHRLVGQMGGEIRVESTPGTGSRFEVRLPYIAAAPAPAAETPPAVEPAQATRRLQGLRLLVAEDAEINQLVLIGLLEAEGAKVEVAGDGRQALERVIDNGVSSYDVVLMDVQMPVMDGIEAAQRLRTLAPALPVIGQTAHALQEERDKCLAAGMVDHIAKPVDLEDLVAVVLRHARPDGAAPAVAAPSPRAQIGDGTKVDWPAFQQRLKMRGSFAERLAATLVESHSETVEILRKAIADQDLSTIAATAHRLKGVVGNLYLSKFQQLAGDTETAALAGDGDALARAAALLPLLERLLADTRAFLAARGMAQSHAEFA